MTAPSVTCPFCGRTSRHPVDVAEGYCGHCKGYTQPETRDCGVCGDTKPVMGDGVIPHLVARYEPALWSSVRCVDFTWCPGGGPLDLRPFVILAGI